MEKNSNGIVLIISLIAIIVISIISTQISYDNHLQKQLATDICNFEGMDFDKIIEHQDTRKEDRKVMQDIKTIRCKSQEGDTIIYKDLERDNYIKESNINRIKYKEVNIRFGMDELFRLYEEGYTNCESTNTNFKLIYRCSKVEDNQKIPNMQVYPLDKGFEIVCQDEISGMRVWSYNQTFIDSYLFEPLMNEVITEMESQQGMNCEWRLIW